MTTQDENINEGEDDADGDLEDRLDRALGIMPADEDATEPHCIVCGADPKDCDHIRKPKEETPPS